MTGSIRINSVSFSFVDASGQKFLECSTFGSHAATYRIAVQVMSERAPLKGKSSGCLCFKPKWVPVSVMVDGGNQDVLIKVSDVVKKWGVRESQVRQESEENFENLAVMAAQSNASRPILDDLELEADEKESYNYNFLQAFPFNQLTHFFSTYQNESERNRVLEILQLNWKGIEKLIQTKKSHWKEVCSQQGGIPSLLFKGVFPLEYFSADGSIWMHLNCGKKSPLVLNLCSGILCMRRVIQPEFRHAYRKIEEVALNNPGIEALRVSAFSTSAGNRIYRTFIPYFELSMDRALQDKLITLENRDLFIKAWLEGLAALHAAGVCHGTISDSALLLQGYYELKSFKAVLGSFEHPILLNPKHPASLKEKDVEMLGVSLERLCLGLEFGNSDRSGKLIGLFKKMQNRAPNPITAADALKLFTEL